MIMKKYIECQLYTVNIWWLICVIKYLYIRKIGNLKRKKNKYLVEGAYSDWRPSNTDAYGGESKIVNGTDTYIN